MIEEVVAWFTKERTPRMDKGDAIEYMHTAHPRTRFLKTLPAESCVLDANAADGGLEVFRRWPPPARPDLRLYAFAPTKGAQFDAYNGYELGDWSSGTPSFPDVQFDAVLCSKVIEHLDDAAPVLDWVSQRLRKEGRLYLEWPSPFSRLLPSRDDLAKRGIFLTISNFHDDPANKRIHDRSTIAGVLSNSNFLVEAQGYLSLPFSEEEVLAHVTRGLDDAYGIQMAYFSRTRWLQYLVAVKR